MRKFLCAVLAVVVLLSVAVVGPAEARTIRYQDKAGNQMGCNLSPFDALITAIGLGAVTGASAGPAIATGLASGAVTGAAATVFAPVGGFSAAVDGAGEWLRRLDEVAGREAVLAALDRIGEMKRWER